MLPQKVIFKGVRDGIMVIVDAKATLDEVMACLNEHARLGRDFFAGSAALLNVSDGELPQEHIDAVSKYLTSEMGFSEVRTANVPPRSVQSSVAAAMDTAEQRLCDDGQASLSSSPTADATMFVKRTLRSGQKVNYVGHVVIMGDVNPGAEIVAGGDIIVLGSLRGVAHAGATGTDTSSVFALKLQPTQLRIANYIARPPDGDNRVPTAPEVASIKDGRLVIETYNLPNRG